jgi:hypothetical protein
MDKESTTTRVRALNDALRMTGLGGQVMITRGVEALGPAAQASAIAAMRSFTAFNEDNDPHGEHDFGRFENGGHAFFFKVDYYDLNLEGGSDEPGDTQKTRRVLTLMLCEEY